MTPRVDHSDGLVIAQLCGHLFSPECLSVPGCHFREQGRQEEDGQAAGALGTVDDHSLDASMPRSQNGSRTPSEILAPDLL